MKNKMTDRYLYGGYNMLQKQKETIVALLKSDESSKHYKRNYCFSYKDYLDAKDKFTEFSCENLDGKQEYIAIIENLLHADETAKIFVPIYGLDEDNGNEFIYADTLIIYSTLLLLEIKRIFKELEDIFPSDLGELQRVSKILLSSRSQNVQTIVTRNE